MTKPDEDVTGSAGRLDPITLEIVWNGLRSINDETWITIQKSAFSTNIKERHDHSTAPCRLRPATKTAQTGRKRWSWNSFAHFSRR